MVHQTPTCCGKPQSPATNGRCYNLPYEKIGKNEPVCIADEVPFEIPESWEWVRLKDIVIKEIKRGKSPTYANSGNILVFAQKCNTKAGNIDLSLAKHLDLKVFAKYPDEEYMQNNDIVVNSTGNGTLGRIGIFRDSDRIDGCIIVPDSHVTTVRINAALISDYIYYALTYYQPYLEKNCSGSTNQTELKPAVIANLFIPVPPYAEQSRIIKKLSDVLPLVMVYNDKESALETYNNDFPSQLKKSILQYAVQGRLAPQDPTDEPASVLLERIRAEKEQLIKSGKIKRDKHESVIFRRDNSYYERVDGIERCIDDEIPFEIPESWEWARIKHVGLITTGNTPSKAHPEYFGTDIPFVSPGDIHDGKIDVPSQGLSFEGMKVGRIIPQGSILQVCIGGSIGKAAICNCEISFNQQINAIEPIICNSKYLLYVISSAYFISKIKDKAGGTATPIISKGLWENVLIPLSPFKEQQRIVARIDALLHKLVALQ